MRNPNHDKHPFVAAPGGEAACVAGWETDGQRLREALTEEARTKTVLAVECYSGVDEMAVAQRLTDLLRPSLVIRAADAFKPDYDINLHC